MSILTRTYQTGGHIPSTYTDEDGSYTPTTATNSGAYNAGYQALTPADHTSPATPHSTTASSSSPHGQPGIYRRPGDSVLYKYEEGQWSAQNSDGTWRPTPARDMDGMQYYMPITHSSTPEQATPTQQGQSMSGMPLDSYPAEGSNVSLSDDEQMEAQSDAYAPEREQRQELHREKILSHLTPVEAADMVARGMDPMSYTRWKRDIEGASLTEGKLVRDGQGRPLDPNIYGYQQGDLILSTPDSLEKRRLLIEDMKNSRVPYRKHGGLLYKL